MSAGPYPIEQIFLDLFLGALPWFILARIVNRAIFRRVHSEVAGYVLVLLGAVLNVLLIWYVAPYFTTPASKELTVAGAVLGMVCGSALGMAGAQTRVARCSDVLDVR
jgi:phosphate/sulfate permease